MKTAVKSLLTVVLVACLFAMAADAARAAAGKLVHVYVAVPTTYSSTVTPQQAESYVYAALGTPFDVPCIGSHLCTMNGWFKHEIGQVFDYDVTIVPMTWGVTPGERTDSCGSTGGFGWYYAPAQDLAAAGAGFSKNDRTMTLLMGGGGWAGHFAPNNDVSVHQGMSGDWGVMLREGVPNACLTAYGAPVTDMFSGFGHEFMGMMGAYSVAEQRLGDGYADGGLFQGDPMGSFVKKSLLQYSGRWLRNP